MVTESFGYKPYHLDWSNIFSKSQEKEKIWIGTLYMVMVTESFE